MKHLYQLSTPNGNLLVEIETDKELVVEQTDSFGDLLLLIGKEMLLLRTLGTDTSVSVTHTVQEK